jgi:hypothetical protein
MGHRWRAQTGTLESKLNSTVWLYAFYVFSLVILDIDILAVGALGSHFSMVLKYVANHIGTSFFASSSRMWIFVTQFTESTIAGKALKIIRCRFIRKDVAAARLGAGYNVLFRRKQEKVVLAKVVRGDMSFDN